VTSVVAAALLSAGCGPSSHANDPRPPTPAEITVNIAPTQVQVQPFTAGVSNKTTANLSQNQTDPADTPGGPGGGTVTEPQADPKADLVVHFTISNATTTNTALEIRGPNIAEAKVSPEIVGSGNGVYQIALPTGRYRIDAADIPAARPAPFIVGPERTSSQQDLLLP
jgi:hypothetical protein